MKRILALALLVVMVATLFIGCAGKEEFKCDLCKKDVESVKHEVEIAGKDLEICDDCNEELEELEDAAEDIKEGFEDLAK